ncbi:bifunctional chorismate mutase/prephenate dehydrogenase [Glaciecola sp. 1036]|uniref:bifunctional chorismate mutase/prephenate dehydrogenase n=1 Tax=Alteromonadaceae TaxID=72275 RepID=UPI003CFCBA64
MSSEELSKALGELRDQIDEVDAELVRLLKRRTAITTKVGALKSQHAMPVYVPEREKSLIEARRAQAEDAGVNPDLVEDILRRMFRESYHSQHASYAKVKGAVDNVVVIGGRGALGSLFVKLFSQTGYQVDIIDKDDWSQADQTLSKAQLVIVAVPINKTIDVIHSLPTLPADCILADVTSIKQKPLTAMLNQHSGPVVGLHPMFGPDAPGMIRQVVVVCHGQQSESYEWLIAQMELWGAAIYQSTAEQHDKAMSIIQVMRHFSSFVYGLHLQQENPDLKELIAFSSPIYRLELAMVGRLFAQAPELYADIIFQDAKNFALLENFVSRFQGALELLKNNDKAGFISAFNEVSEWFGDYAQQCLVDSKKMLLKADDSHLLRQK